ncbi:MAG: EVE domain-containing protein [Acidobacteria bacterium]|nr:EVE domain-containing protein [Acidobacteriota bacterium]
MPQHWLFKTEPVDYSYDDLEREGRTVWSGVHNALALKNLRQLRIGDQILIYHTGSEKAIVGLAEAVSDPYPDSDANDEKLLVVAIRPLRRFSQRATLQQIKNCAELADFDLVRLPRLSVMPVTDRQWEVILDLL